MAEIMESTKKAFTYRGKTLEELKALDTREFAKFLGARERRSVLRQFQKIENFVNRSKKKMQKNKAIKTHDGSIIIIPQMVTMKIGVYNGKEFVQVEIVPEMLGHRLGEFSLSRGKTKHGSAGLGATKGSKSKAKK
jgi:small subunit ribosomal protein S19